MDNRLGRHRGAGTGADRRSRSSGDTILVGTFVGTRRTLGESPLYRPPRLPVAADSFHGYGPRRRSTESIYVPC